MFKSIRFLSSSIVRVISSRTFLLAALFSFAYLVPTTAHAQLGNISCGDKETYIALFDACLDFGSAVGLTVTWALLIGTLLAGIKLAIGAVQFILSTGDPQKLQNARDTLTDAFLGLILLVSAWVLFGYLEASFPDSWNINLLNLGFTI